MGQCGSKSAVHPDLVARLAVIEHRLGALEKAVTGGVKQEGGGGQTAGPGAGVTPAKKKPEVPSSAPSAAGVGGLAAAAMAAAAGAAPSGGGAAAPSTTGEHLKKGKSLRTIAAVVAADSAPTSPMDLESPRPSLKPAKAQRPLSDEESRVVPVPTVFSPGVMRKLPKNLTHVDPDWFPPEATFKPGLENLLKEQAGEVMDMALGKTPKDAMVRLPLPGEESVTRRLNTGLAALGLKTRTSKKDGKDFIVVSPGADIALPWWLVPVTCSGGHHGTYRKIILDCALSAVAVLCKIMVVPESLEKEKQFTATALNGLRSRCIAKALIEPGEICSLSVPFGRYFVKYFAAPMGMNGATLVSKLETSMDELKAKGGYPDFVRDFDIDTGRTGNIISLCGLGGEHYPEGVALKCGGPECILSTTGAAAYTGLSLNISGAGKR